MSIALPHQCRQLLRHFSIDLVEIHGHMTGFRVSKEL